MKKLLTPSRTLAVPLIVAYCTCTVAQSLGTPAADLWIGQPLEISVPARFASNEADDQCVHAEVAYGDKPLRGGVRTSIVGTDGNRRVRIQADTPIDEAVVTLLLRAGCRNTVTRSYTLLPEIPSEAVLAALMRPQAPALLTAAAASATSQRSPRLPTARALPPAAAAADASGQGAAAVAMAPPRITRALLRGGPARGARLRLAPIETDAQAFLRVSTTLAEPQGDAARRATAALLWQAINADPQDLLRTSALLQKLEGEMVQLRRSAQQTHQDMVDLRRRLDEPRPWYASSRLAGLLGLLVLAAAAGAGTLWFRTRRLDLARGPWYAGMEDPVQPPQAAPAPAEAPVRPAVAPSLRTQPLPVQPVPAAPQDVAPVVPDAAPVTAGRSGPGPIDFTLPVAPQRTGGGVLRVETLAATFEEVEFLSSLGLSADAMEVLKTYLQDSSSPSPLAYYELMRLCDHDEDPAAVTAVRRRHAQVFGVEAPTLQQVTAARGLDAIPGLSERITRAWDSAEVVDLIEQALFTVPPPRDALTLQAGRDLMALHDLAMALVNDAGQPDADAQPLAPWADADDPAAATQAVADADGGHQFALDVDLGAAPERLPETQAPQRAPEPDLELELAPLLAEMQAAAAREATARAQAEAEDAFSAAVALERAPAGRF